MIRKHGHNSAPRITTDEQGEHDVVPKRKLFTGKRIGGLALVFAAAAGPAVSNQFTGPTESGPRGGTGVERVVDADQRLEEAKILAQRYDFRIKEVKDLKTPPDTSGAKPSQRQLTQVAITIGAKDKPTNEVAKAVKDYPDDKEIQQHRPRIIVAYDYPNPEHGIPERMKIGHEFKNVDPLEPHAEEGDVQFTVNAEQDVRVGTTATVYSVVANKIVNAPNEYQDEVRQVQPIDKLLLTKEGWEHYEAPPENMPQPTPPQVG